MIKMKVKSEIITFLWGFSISGKKAQNGLIISKNLTEIKKIKVLSFY